MGLVHRARSVLDGSGERGDRAGRLTCRTGTWSQRVPSALSRVLGCDFYGTPFPAVQNLLLAARAAGLGAALNVMPLWNLPLARTTLGLPPWVTPVAVVPLGWPRGHFGPTSRPPVETRRGQRHAGRTTCTWWGPGPTNGVATSPSEMPSVATGSGATGTRPSSRISRRVFRSIAPPTRAASTSSSRRPSRPLRCASRTPTRTDRQHASPEAGSPASLPLLVMSHSCICRREGGLDAETEELVDDHPGPGAAGSALCNAVVARQPLPCEGSEERAPPSQAAAWTWPAAGIEEQSGLMVKAEEPRKRSCRPASRMTFTVASDCTA